MRNEWDVIIIGAGVSGCAAARFLSRFTDRILVLENGRVVQQGTHDQLIREDGLYASIFHIQSALSDEAGEIPAQREVK